MYNGPYSALILSAVRRKFDYDCKAHEVPVDQRFSELNVFFSCKAYNHHTDNAALYATEVNDAFNPMQDHFMTPAHRDTYTTEWNTPASKEVNNKPPETPTSQCLDTLIKRERDLQSLFDKDYQSPSYFVPVS